MAGNYSHTTRATGLTLTATIYNSDHTNHITNHTPTGLDDYSANLSQMQTTTDPSGGSLATSGAGEFERLRFQFAAMNPTNTNWYDAPPVIRSNAFAIAPGATPNTNINVVTTATERSYNIPTITDATDLAKSGSSGSFSLDATGGILTFNITENITGILAVSFERQDLNSSSTTEMYFAGADINSDNIRINIHKRGSVANVDMTTIFDAGDSALIVIAYITAS